MKDNHLLSPIFKKIDTLIFGFQDMNEVEKKSEYLEVDTEEEFDVERSIN